MSPAASGRWCPTPEQLMILEEMYRAGIRTPSTSQIKQITAHLSSYGKIEGKNVFYWFQNHKARDRQKLRRKLAKQQQLLFQQQHLSPNYGLCYVYLDPYQSLGSWTIRYYNPTPAPSHSMNYPPQAGTNGGGWSRMLAIDSKSQKREIMGGDYRHQKAEMDKNLYNSSWIMIVDMDSLDLCASRPLKTLELFPTTSTNP